MMRAPARRKHIPLKAQLHAALRQLGFEPHEVELDHSPALVLREWDDEAQDTVPPASDPRFLIWRPKAEHAAKTFGHGGEKRITTAGSDIGNAAKVKRIEKDPAGGEEFRRRILETKRGERPERPRSRIPCRPFPNRKRSKP